MADMKSVYIVEVTLLPHPDGKLRQPLHSFLYEGELFGQRTLLMSPEQSRAKRFTDKAHAQAAGREWSGGDKYREYRVVQETEARRG